MLRMRTVNLYVKFEEVECIGLKRGRSPRRGESTPPVGTQNRGSGKSFVNNNSLDSHQNYTVARDPKQQELRIYKGAQSIVLASSRPLQNRLL